jgi:beta-galactosidase GanA
MAVLKEMFREEKERLLRMKKFYVGKILELPKGSIIFKKRGKRKYPYLIYREKNKVKTDYLKFNNDEIKDLEFKIKKRKKYLKLLREIEKDLKVFK